MAPIWQFYLYLPFSFFLWMSSISFILFSIYNSLIRAYTCFWALSSWQKKLEVCASVSREEEVKRLEAALKRAESSVDRDKREEVEQKALQDAVNEEKRARKQGKTSWWMSRCPYIQNLMIEVRVLTMLLFISSRKERAFVTCTLQRFSCVWRGFGCKESCR